MSRLWANALTSLSILVLALSCGKDGDTTPTKSRDIKFEVTGSFTGRLNTTFITASGGATSESIPSLPWTKSISFATTVPAVSITVAGGGGVSGQNLNVKVYAGGKIVSETPGVADSNGTIVIASPAYIF